VDSWNRDGTTSGAARSTDKAGFVRRYPSITPLKLFGAFFTAAEIPLKSRRGGTDKERNAAGKPAAGSG
jgi:hypothetical protein